MSSRPAIDAALREPAHQVSPRAIGYWRVGAGINLTFWVVAAIVWYLLSPHPWWAVLIAVAVVAVSAAYAVVMPTLRYRIHRWEVTPDAIFTRSGWLSREQRIAPLNRVQTVDSHQGALMRVFGLSSITITTASAAGPISIDCLDHEVARRVVGELTEITSAAEGDAT
ncbi:PH domain-containing protein [Nocardioides bigeumensis]|uniref:PH domain-containing protein n=1 Tax=Nocardioides bigeumensis TaxID=433657 RepID=A0ABP5KD29_9ACTN